jgi:hypothetical protein
VPTLVAPMPKRPRSRLLAKLSLGYGYHFIDGDSVNTAAFEVELGGEGQHAAGGVRFGFELGQTGSGRSFESLVLGPGVEWKLGQRLRLGMAPTLSFLFVDDPYSNGTLGAVAIGFWVDASYDLWQRKTGGALYLAARIGYDWMIYSDTTGDAMVARLWLGYRF